MFELDESGILMERVLLEARKSGRACFRDLTLLGD